MIPPASATAITSSIWVGVKRERHRHLARIDPARQLGEAAAAADEVDALVGALVGDAEDRLDQIVGEQRDRQPSTGSAAGTSSGFSRNGYHPPFRYMPNSRAPAGRTGEADGDTAKRSAMSRTSASGARPLRSRITRL